MPQLIPVGLELTEPEPCTMTLSANWPVATAEKVAVTVVAAFSATVQVPVPVHPVALHPVNWNPVAGVAVRVTFVPAGYDELQVAPHAMPAGAETTVPEPLTVTARLTGCGC